MYILFISPYKTQVQYSWSHTVPYIITVQEATDEEAL